MAGNSGRKLTCKVILLDDSIQTHLVQRKAIGSELYSLVYEQIKLIETDYFGLEYVNKSNEQEWLDKEKTILSQTGASSGKELSFKFKVKFYTSEPTLLEHDTTRYFFALQVKQDLASGQLSCNDNTAAILAAYIVQIELGDFYYQPNEHDYLKSIKLLPNQNDEMEDRIAENHKLLRGLAAVEAEFQLLDVARKTEMYGIVLHTCATQDGIVTQLAVTHNGIHSISNGMKNSSYIWVKIRKLGFKRRRFLIKFFPSKEKPKTESMVEYIFHTRDAAKSFWKLAVEHHSFFRKLEIRPTRRTRRPLLTRGSSFRYCGRTQTQLVEQMKLKWGQTTFDRSMSLKSFPTTSIHHFGKSSTFHDRQDLGVMTLDRDRQRNAAKLTVPSVSQATLESRYSGCYETAPPPTSSSASLLPVSQSLSAIASLAKSNSKFDIKTSSTFLPKKDGERDSHRDSIAVVEDNRVELERLVEQINSDLTSAQKAGQNTETVNRASSIEMFLSSTSQPVQIPDKLQDHQREPKQDLAEQQSVTKTSQESISLTKQEALPDDNTQNSNNLYLSSTAVTCTISDDETLEILLRENIKDTPVTDLDNDDQPPPPLTRIEIELNTHTVKVDNSADLLSSPEEGAAQSDNKSTSKFIKQEAVDQDLSVSPGVVVLSSPDTDDEDLVYRSGLEISLPPPIRRSRTRSRQEEMDGLEGLSQLAEDVLKYDKDPDPVLVNQKSQELSDLATQVLDFCNDSEDERERELSDLSELLAHYDTIKQQQQRFNHDTPAYDTSAYDTSAYDTSAYDTSAYAYHHSMGADIPKNGIDSAHINVNVPKNGINSAHMDTDIPKNGIESVHTCMDTNVPKNGIDNAHMETDIPKNGIESVHTCMDTNVPKNGFDSAQVEAKTSTIVSKPAMENSISTSLPPSERTKRKPLTRPALPVLISSKVHDWHDEMFKSDWLKSEKSSKFGIRVNTANTDSGIEIINQSNIRTTSNGSGMQSAQSSSDGYSSGGEDGGGSMSNPHLMRL